jgi:hypothetical protein
VTTPKADPAGATGESPSGTYIYVRYSDDKQRPESCDDQERTVRRDFIKFGVDPTDAVVIKDEAVSGTKGNRAGFQRLRELIDQGKVRTLGVDDQSRLTRGDNAATFIQNLVYNGGRFISTREGIDTRVRGWKSHVKLKEVHHSLTIDDNTHRVRRGQEGRVVADESAGDFPYGIESYYLDANWAEQIARRGPKPKKGLRICDAQARWVRQVFEWFADGWTIGAIVRELTRLGVDRGNKAKPNGWHRAQVDRMLRNRKYIGEWKWGATTTLRNSEGKTRQVPAPADEVTVRHRPNLRIVPQDLWDRVQARLGELQGIYGQKEGQKRRGARKHWNTDGARTLLGGLLRCACGARLWHCSAMDRGYYACPEHKKGRCPVAARVPGEKAERAMFDFLTGLLAGWPAWLREVCDQTRAAVRRAVDEQQAGGGDDELRLGAVRKELENLVGRLGRDGFESRTVERRIVDLEQEEGRLEARLEARERSQGIRLPDDGWVRAELDRWVGDLASGGPAAAVVLRKAVGEVRFDSVVAAGKKRGYIRLRFRVKAWDMLVACMGAALPPSVVAGLPAGREGDGLSPEFTIDLGGPTNLDRWAPQIAEWRAAGVLWEEIVKRTGLDLSRVYVAWKRYVGATGGGPPLADPPEADL